MIILFEKYSKYKLGDLVLLKFDPNILNPWTYPIGKVVGFGDDGVKLRLKTYPSDSKKLKYVRIFVKLEEIERIITEKDVNKYIDKWLEKLKILQQSKKYNL